MDIPRSLKQALSSDKHCHKLLLKSKGYTAGIVAVCQSLDLNLQTIYNDLNMYFSHGDGIARKSADNEASVDTADIVHYLQDSSRDGLSELITTIKSTNCEETQSTLIILATLLTAITELCPNLRLCLAQQHAISNSTTWSKSTSASGSSSNDQWINVCKLLDDEAIRFWNKWICLFVGDLLGTGQHFSDTVDFNSLTKDLLSWEQITVEEKDEQDQPVQSTIRVPAHPSVSLQLFLHAICARLNEMVPYTLRRVVTNLLTDELTQCIHRIYGKYALNEFVRSNQNASLQYYFDVKFVHMTLVARDNKKTVENLHCLAGEFKSAIDPFDFELFHRYIVVNVKKSAQRMQVGWR